MTFSHTENLPPATADNLLLASARALRDRLAPLTFGPPVHTTYQPLDYAWDGYARYIHLAGDHPRRVVLLGMNPGPWGMTQTGVPFGVIEGVRDWMGLRPTIHRPLVEHPKRPILGLQCPRSEVSGQRLWGSLQRLFGSPASFFRDHFVANYCPLVFMLPSGANLTPDKLPASERLPLEAACDEHLRALLAGLRPPVVIGIGRYAQNRLQALGYADARYLTHPAPANPHANRGWTEHLRRALADAGTLPPVAD